MTHAATIPAVRQVLRGCAVRSNSPAARIRAAATSSLARLLKPFLASRNDPASSFSHHRSAQGGSKQAPRTLRNRERPILSSGPQRPNVERRFTPSSNAWRNLTRKTCISKFVNPKPITDQARRTPPRIRYQLHKHLGRWDAKPLRLNQDALIGQPLIGPTRYVISGLLIGQTRQTRRDRAGFDSSIAVETTSRRPSPRTSQIQRYDWSTFSRRYGPLRHVLEVGDGQKHR